MEWLNASQLRTQAVRMFENYTYSVIVKKLGRSKGWVSKWTRRCKRNLQSAATNKTALGWCLCTHIKGYNQLTEIQHWTYTFHWKIGFLICLVWSIVAAAVYASPRPDTGTRTSSSEILEINFFDHCAKSHQFDAWQTEGSHQKQRSHCSILILSLHNCIEVTLCCCVIVQFWGVATLLSIIIAAEQLSV